MHRTAKPGTYPVVHADVSPERKAQTADAGRRLYERLRRGDAQALTEDDNRREAVDADQRAP